MFSMQLPHCEYVASKTPQECLEHFRTSLDKEIDLAISKDFFEVSDQERYELIYPKYEEQYSAYAQGFRELLSEPLKSVHWEDEDYPEWAVGEYVTVWEYSSDEFLWLRLHHEDRELPIMLVVAVISPPSYS